MTDVGRIWTDIATKNGPHPVGRGGWVDWVIGELAALQYGVVAVWQLVALGVGRGAVKHRVGRGRLHRIHQGVYAVGHRHVVGNGKLMAAVLAAGEGAVISHLSAAVHLGLLRGYRGPVHVTTKRAREGLPKLAVHRVRSLHPDDCATHERIPCTTVARTLIDLAEAAPKRLARAFEEAENRRLFDLRALLQARDRARGRRSLKQIDALIAKGNDFVPWTRSELERAFVAMCEDENLPPPSMNINIAGHEVDACWPDTKLIVELDSYATHHTHRAFERDRTRDIDLALAGYRPIRVTDRRMQRERRVVADQVRSLLHG